MKTMIWPLASLSLTILFALSCSGENNSSNEPCGSYDTSIYRCEMGELIGKCKGEDYYIAYEQCDNGVIVNTRSSEGKGSPSSSSNDFDNSSFVYGGQTYKTIKIGNQIWMAENLNYKVSGSECYDNSEGSCDRYGRFYDWARAMALPTTSPSYCNNYECVVSAKHQGICPDGWHIPTRGEWETLIKYVDPASATSQISTSNNAGKKLREEFGFATQLYYYEGDRRNFYWTATQNGSGYSSAGAGRYMISYSDSRFYYYSNSAKIAKNNIRCVKN